MGLVSFREPHSAPPPVSTSSRKATAVVFSPSLMTVPAISSRPTSMASAPMAMPPVLMIGAATTMPRVSGERRLRLARLVTR